MGAPAVSMRAFAFAVAALLAGPLTAQDYPVRPIRWVTPYPPGGSTTFVSRLIGDRLAEAFGKPVVIDNRPGGNTVIGSDAVAKATPDGYTVLLAGNSQLVQSLLMKPPYDVFRDFAPVTIIAKTNYILVATPALPVNSLQEFIAYARARPGQVDVASVATGSSQHLMGELFNMLAGVKLNHVPGGGAPAPRGLGHGAILHRAAEDGGADEVRLRRERKDHQDGEHPHRAIGQWWRRACAPFANALRHAFAVSVAMRLMSSWPSRPATASMIAFAWRSETMPLV